MSDKEHNFLTQMFTKRYEQEEKGRVLQKDVKVSQQITMLMEKIDKLSAKEQDLSSINARLDQHYELLVKISLKVDLSVEEEETLALLKQKVLEKK